MHKFEFRTLFDIPMFLAHFCIDLQQHKLEGNCNLNHSNYALILFWLIHIRTFRSGAKLFWFDLSPSGRFETRSPRALRGMHKAGLGRQI